MGGAIHLDPFVCVTFFSRGAPEWVGGIDPNSESTLGGLVYYKKHNIIMVALKIATTYNILNNRIVH